MESKPKLGRTGRRLALIPAALTLISAALFPRPALHAASPDLAAAAQAAADVGESTTPAGATTAIDPLALTDDMRAHIDRRVSRSLPRYLRLLELQHAIFDPLDGLGITYGSSLTRTAAETFTEGDGNCLSFTLLFVALARHLGLKPHFVEVDQVVGWSQRGEVDLSHWHMYAEIDLEGGVATVDFLPWSERRYQAARRISETRARAHYHNNVGADLLTAGEPDAALAQFQLALELDPSFSPAKVNMAVALGRVGAIEQAEAALLEVLAADRGDAVAASNLVRLYREQGRTKEANRWSKRRNALLDSNPFHHFRLGMTALAADRPTTARDHFKRAIRLQPEEGAFFEQLAECFRRLGKPRKVQTSLQRALQRTDDPERRKLLADRLAEAVRADG